MRQLFLINAGDSLQCRERENPPVKLQQRLHIEFIDQFVFTIKHSGIAISIGFRTLNVEVDTFLYLFLELIEIARVGNYPSWKQ